MNEVWVPLVHEGIMKGYEISNLGHIRVKDSDVAPMLNFRKVRNKNYVKLLKDDSTPTSFKTKVIYVPYLVAETFIPIPAELENVEVTVSHIDQNDCANDSCYNLKWIEFKQRSYVHMGKDGRYRLIYTRPDGTTSTVSYPKYLMEHYLGRKLLPTEDVHHIDENPMNNDVNNLVIIDHAAHVRSHTKYVYHHMYIQCDICHKIFLWTVDCQKRYIRDTLIGKRRFITCSKSCASYIARKLQCGFTIDVPEHSEVIQLRETGSIS